MNHALTTYVVAKTWISLPIMDHVCFTFPAAVVPLVVSFDELFMGATGVFVDRVGVVFGNSAKKSCLDGHYDPQFSTLH